jgi:hypothetical protein
MSDALPPMTSATPVWTRIDSVLGEAGGVEERIRGARGLDRWLTSSLLWSFAGAAAFGAALGTYGHSAAQLALAAVKLPVLLLGTAALCFPTFHVLQRLRSPRPLNASQSLALQGNALAAVGGVWGSCAPPLGFLVATCQDYRLAQFLALAVGTAGGLAGLRRMIGAHRRLTAPQDVRPRSLFLLPWGLLFAVVGGQLAWILRPFIGSPSLGFQLLRPLEGSMFGYLLHLAGVR